MDGAAHGGATMARAHLGGSASMRTNMVGNPLRMGDGETVDGGQRLAASNFFITTASPPCSKHTSTKRPVAWYRATDR